MAHTPRADESLSHAGGISFVPDSPAELFGSFSTVAVVGSAAASLDVLGRHATGSEWLRWNGQEVYDGKGWAGGFDPGFGLREGVVFRMEVSPGSIAFRRRDYVRAAATAERGRENADRMTDLIVSGMHHGPFCVRATGKPDCGHESCRPPRRQARRRGRVTSWSAKSRAKMVERLATLDYEPLVGGGRAPAMLTLTYPADWLTVAPSAAVCAEHVVKFRKRFQRRWGVPLIGVWKREFQRRGAPHYHLLMCPPAGREFDLWVSATWAAIVAHPDAEERAKHVAAGTNVDRREGSRFTDPRRVGVYFSKHGSFSAKDYQNDAPEEWLEDPEAGVGRFWGVWGLSPAVAAVHVDPDVSDALRRTARRWEAATMLRRPDGAPATMVRTVWRKRTTVDRETGEIGFRWVKRSARTRIRPHLSGRAGFMTVNDAPALAMDLGRYASLLVGEPKRC